MGRFYRKLLDLVTLNFWREMSRRDIPRWVIRASDRFYERNSVRPYNKMIFLKGKNHVYRVWFEMIGQGQIKTRYYVKSRTV